MRRVPRTVSLRLTTTQNGAVAFSSAPLWVVDGLFRVSTNALTLSGKNDTAGGISYGATVDLSIRYLALHELLVRPSTGGSNGTLDFIGTVLETEEELVAYLYGRGG